MTGGASFSPRPRAPGLCGEDLHGERDEEGVHTPPGSNRSTMLDVVWPSSPQEGKRHASPHDPDRQETAKRGQGPTPGDGKHGFPPSPFRRRHHREYFHGGIGVSGSSLPAPSVPVPNYHSSIETNSSGPATAPVTIYEGENEGITAFSLVQGDMTCLCVPDIPRLADCTAVFC